MKNTVIFAQGIGLRLSVCMLLKMMLIMGSCERMFLTRELKLSTPKATEISDKLLGDIVKADEETRAKMAKAWKKLKIDPNRPAEMVCSIGEFYGEKKEQNTRNTNG